MVLYTSVVKGFAPVLHHQIITQSANIVHQIQMPAEPNQLIRGSLKQSEKFWLHESSYRYFHNSQFLVSDLSMDTGAGNIAINQCIYILAVYYHKKITKNWAFAQRCIQNPDKHLRWGFLRKFLRTLNR